MKSKSCTKCGRRRPLRSGFRFIESKGRHLAECFACEAARKKEYKQRNRDRLRELDRIWQSNNRERVKAAQERWKARNPGLAKERAAAWYARNRTMVRARERARYQELKERVFAAYGGYHCACCGETEPKFLSIDHVKNDGALRRKLIGYGVGRNGGGIKLFKQIIEEKFPPTYQVLCMNCNWGKARNGGICPHEIAKVQRLSRKGVRPSGRKRAAPVSRVKI